MEGLAPGDDISVRIRKGKKFQGKFNYADPEHLIIWSQERSFPGRVVVKRGIHRSDVRQVRFNHRLGSMAAGAAIGLGIGVGLGAAIDAGAKSNEDHGLAGFVFGIFGRALGAILGKTHPFIRKKTIYMAP